MTTRKCFCGSRSITTRDWCCGRAIRGACRRCWMPTPSSSHWSSWRWTRRGRSLRPSSLASGRSAEEAAQRGEVVANSHLRANLVSNQEVCLIGPLDGNRDLNSRFCINRELGLRDPERTGGPQKNLCIPWQLNVRAGGEVTGCNVQDRRAGLVLPICCEAEGGLIRVLFYRDRSVIFRRNLAVMKSTLLRPCMNGSRVD